MKNYIILALILSSIGFAFSVDTITNFPTQMYGGGTYSASYHVNGDAIYPIYALVTVSDDMNVVGCTHNGQWVCNISTQDFNITISPVSNIMPDNYNITTQFSANYTIPDQTSTPSYQTGSSGGGSIYGYVPKNDTKAKEIADAEAAIKSGEELLNRINQQNNTENTTEQNITFPIYNETEPIQNYSYNISIKPPTEQEPLTSASMTGLPNNDLSILGLYAIISIAGLLMLDMSKLKGNKDLKPPVAVEGETV